MTFVAGNALWTLYFFLFLLFGLIFLISPSKQKAIIIIYILAIPFNITKNLGVIIITDSEIIWQKGITSLAYFSINEVLIYGLVAFSVITYVIHKNKLPTIKQDKFFLFFVTSILISVLYNEAWLNFGLKHFRMGFYLFLVYYYFSRYFIMKDHVQIVFYPLIVILFLEIIVCSCQMLHISMPILEFLAKGQTGQMAGFYDSSFERVSGTMGHPNGFSSFMVLLIPLVFSGGLYLKGQKQLLAYLFSLLGVVMVFYSLSRSGWLALTVQIIIFSLLGRHILPKWFYNKFLWIVGLTIFFIFISLNWDAVHFRFYSSESAGAALSRIIQSKVALNYIINNFWFGIGPGNYEVNLEKMDRLLNVSSYGLAVHNMYLLNFAEKGIIGIISYLSIFFVTIRHLIKIIKIKQTYSIIALGLLAAIIGHMIQNMFELAEIVGTISVFLFFIFGISFSMKINEQHKPKMEEINERP